MLNFKFENLDNLTNFVDCPDLNESGIRRFGTSPLLNAAHLFYAFNHKPLGMEYYDVKGNVDNYIISASVNHIPNDWTGYHPKVESLFKHLNESYLNDLRNKKALLLLDQSFEGYQTSWLWDWFHDECKEWKISPKCIVYVTGNMIADETYEEWCNDKKINERMKVIPYAHFELDMAMTCYHRNKIGEPTPTFEDHIKYKTEHLNDIKTYGCYNKRIRGRHHRIWFYKYLCEAGLIDKGLVSMNAFSPERYYFEGEVINDEEAIYINQDLPKLVYGKRNDELDDNFYICRFNNEQSLDTYTTVISEAQCGDSDKTMFLSEKTFKVIAVRHPFIIMGNKDSMRMMRKIGYKTFDGFIDESYDSLPTHERMLAIIESLKKLDKVSDKIEWFKSLENIIEHNYETFISKLYRLPDSFTVLTDYYNNFFKTSKLI